MDRQSLFKYVQVSALFLNFRMIETRDLVSTSLKDYCSSGSLLIKKKNQN